MGGKAKNLTGNKSAAGPGVPMHCPTCKEPLYMSLTLATRHVNACKKQKEIDDKAARKAEAVRVQQPAAAQAGRRGRN